MTYKTKTRKGYDGWEVTSEAILGETPEGTRILKLRTSKNHGGLDTCACVCVRANRGAFFSETTEVFGDFYKRGIAPTPCKRITEKAVSEVHKFALLKMDDLIKEAKAFYSEKDAQSH